MTEDAGRSALERCVGDVDRFLTESWGRGPLSHPNPGSRTFGDLLALEDVDRLMATTGLRTPSFRLVKDGATLPPSSYTRSGRTGSAAVTGMLDPARALAEFHDGATIVFQGAHRFWLPLASFCRQLDLALGHPTQVNAYITPPGARGLAAHVDAHDVFVLQAFGTKRWQVWPTRPASAGGPVEEGTLGDPLMDLEMRPGDSLYLPAGTPHAASTQDAVSGHITVGILTITWRSVAHDVLRRVESQPELAERLPAGFHRDPEGFREAVAAVVADLASGVAAVDPEDVAAAAIRRFLVGRPPVVPGGFADALAVDALDEESVLRRRPEAACVLALRRGRLSVYLGDRELRMPVWLEPILRDLARQEAVRVGDVPGFPDAGSRLVLLRRLVREGLFAIEPPA